MKKILVIVISFLITAGIVSAITIPYFNIENIENLQVQESVLDPTLGASFNIFTWLIGDNGIFMYNIDRFDQVLITSGGSTGTTTNALLEVLSSTTPSAYFEPGIHVTGTSQFDNIIVYGTLTGGNANDWLVTSTNKIGGSLVNDALTPTSSIGLFIDGNSTTTGNLSPNVDNSSDLGNSTIAWDNIYTTELVGGANNDFIIRNNSSDGSDLKVLRLIGGGADSSGRGARLKLHGADTTSGDIWLQVNSTGARVEYYFSSIEFILALTGFFPNDDSARDLGTASQFWDETYSDEIVLQEGTMGTTAANQTRLAGLDLSGGDAGLHIKTENDTEHLFASKVGINTTTPNYLLSLDGGALCVDDGTGVQCNADRTLNAGDLLVGNQATITTSLWIGAAGTIADKIDLVNDLYVRDELEVDGVSNFKNIEIDGEIKILFF